MVDTFPVDFTTSVGKVRNYIPDTEQIPDLVDPTAGPSFLFSDAEIQSFIDDETNGGTLPTRNYRLHRAAAWAMIAIGNTENLILKKIKTQDQATDGSVVSKQFLASAQAMFDRADLEEKHIAENLDWIFPRQTDAPDHVYPWWY